jgi:TonB family protein
MDFSIGDSGRPSTITMIQLPHQKQSRLHAPSLTQISETSMIYKNARPKKITQEPDTSKDKSREVTSLSPSRSESGFFVPGSHSPESPEEIYLAEVIRQLQSSKRYPRSALKQNQSGRVELYLRLQKNGRIENLSIHKSSEFQALNQAAMDTVSRIRRFPEFPEKISREFWDVIVPIEFRIQ